LLHAGNIGYVTPASNWLPTKSIPDYLGHADIKHTGIYAKLQDTKD
jgi:hypothetical protein